MACKVLRKAVGDEMSMAWQLSIMHVVVSASMISQAVMEAAEVGPLLLMRDCKAYESS